MRILIVWSDVPDATCFLIFQNISVELYNKLVSFHGKYINADQDTEDLNDFFYTEDGKFRFEKEKLTEPIFGQGFDAVIHTGFIQ